MARPLAKRVFPVQTTVILTDPAILRLIAMTTYTLLTLTTTVYKCLTVTTITWQLSANPVCPARIMPTSSGHRAFTSILAKSTWLTVITTVYRFSIGLRDYFRVRLAQVGV